MPHKQTNKHTHTHTQERNALENARGKRVRRRCCVRRFLLRVHEQQRLQNRFEEAKCRVLRHDKREILCTRAFSACLSAALCALLLRLGLGLAR